MNIIDIIEKKKKGGKLNKEEIDFFVKGATKASIPDYQLAALLMAICLKGMNDEETYQLTSAMKNSGQVLDLSFAGGTTVDKHSTGGVSDTVTPVLISVLAANGLKVVKMSGRGLSHTGGTIDKLESIKNFNTSLTKEQIINAVKQCGAAITAQTADIAPADKALYALRDVTGTVDSIPLIASSIMSKKLSSGADIIMLDVKYGSGAFMKNAQDAVKLARSMVKIAVKDGKKCAALVTSMQQPLTRYAGCNVEMNSALSVLNGEKNDLYIVAKELCATIFMLANKTDSLILGRKLFDDTIYSGDALEKFKQIITCQGGESEVLKTGFKTARYQKTLYADKSGYIEKIDSAAVGKTVLKLGGGRERKGDRIDHAAGIELNIRLNDYVNKGDIVATLYASKESKFTEAEEIIKNCYSLSHAPVIADKLIYAAVTKKGVQYL